MHFAIVSLLIKKKNRKSLLGSCSYIHTTTHTHTFSVLQILRQCNKPFPNTSTTPKRFPLLIGLPPSDLCLLESLPKTRSYFLHPHEYFWQGIIIVTFCMVGNDFRSKKIVIACGYFFFFFCLERSSFYAACSA